LKSKKFDSFGQALKHVVHQRGLKHSKIASDTGIHYSQVSKYVNGKEMPGERNQEF
jgi:transcriptional regulator with XRE-family HTH domain